MMKLSAWKRLTSPTPKFFKKVRIVGAYLTVISILVLAANSQFTLGLPLIIDTIGSYLGYGGFIAATIASFAVDQDNLNEEERINNS